MKNTVGLLAAAAFGVIATLSFEATGQPAKSVCTGSSDLSRLNKRFDDLEQAITALQAQSTKAAADTSVANQNNQRQLANISSQVADLNTQVVALSGRVSTLPRPSR